jgi:hypothetical protein
MRDVPETLSNWTRVLKSGGYLYVMVPDYLLYEKLTWPSRFNADHRQSFSNTIERKSVVRPNHWHNQNDLIPLLDRLSSGALSAGISISTRESMVRRWPTPWPRFVSSVKREVSPDRIKRPQAVNEKGRVQNPYSIRELKGQCRSTLSQKVKKRGCLSSVRAAGGLPAAPDTAKTGPC